MNGGYSRRGRSRQAVGPRPHRCKHGSSALPGNSAACLRWEELFHHLLASLPDPWGWGGPSSWDFYPEAIPASPQVILILLSGHLSSFAKISPALVCGNETYLQLRSHLPCPFLTPARNQFVSKPYQQISFEFSPSSFSAAIPVQFRRNSQSVTLTLALLVLPFSISVRAKAGFPTTMPGLQVPPCASVPGPLEVPPSPIQSSLIPYYPSVIPACYWTVLLPAPAELRNLWECPLRNSGRILEEEIRYSP